jgi:hypothetical protein
MSTVLDTYRTRVLEQPPYEDSWFMAALSQYRAGDEQARLRILGSGLRLALALVESRQSSCEEGELLRRVEDANSGLTKALTSFSGATSEEFLRHAEAVIAQRLDRSSERK